MPTYDYRCSKCSDQFEVYQTFADEPLKKHPGCGGKVNKVMSAAGIVLKGSGFYKNDSGDSARSLSKKRSEKTTSTTSTSSSSDSTSSAKSETKAETKTETKSDSKATTPAASPKKSDSKTSSAA